MMGERHDQSQSETDVSAVASETDQESEVDPTSSALESDNFSATTSENPDESSLSETQTPTPAKSEEKAAPKKRRKPGVGYQRKYSLKESRAKEMGEQLMDVSSQPTDEVETINVVDTEEEEVNPAGKEEPTEVPEGENLPSSDCPDPHPNAQSIIDNLKLLLGSDRWHFDVALSRIVRIIHHNDSENAAVTLCVYWDCAKNRQGIFVNGYQVPNDNKIFLVRAVPVHEDSKSVSDYLCFLSNFVLKATKCEGIKEYKELWERFEGVTDRSSSIFRSAKEDQRQERKLKKQGIKKKFSAPDDNLTFEELKDKKDKWKKRSKLAERRADRLQKRVEDLQVRLDEVLRNDLLGILRANEHKMTPIQKLFWESQKAALLVKDKRGMRWHPMMIRVALKLHSDSPNAYRYLRDSKIMCLPSDRTLYDYSQYVEPKEGCQQEILDRFRKNIGKKGPEEHNLYVNLMFDEMHIRSGLVTKRSTGELVGYTNLSDVDEELRKLQSDLDAKTYKPKLAKKVLVYFGQGLTSGVQEVVAIYSTDDLSASQLYDRTWQVIYHLEEASIKVLCLTFDGAAVNRKFIRMHPSSDPSAKEVYCRGVLGRKTRKLWKNGQFLSWKVLENLYDLTKQHQYVNHKLTRAHVKLTSFSCMTVVFATQTFSKSVADSIECLASLPELSDFDTDELVKFIRLMNKFFDCVNGKQEDGEDVRNINLVAYTDPNDPRLEWLSTTFLNYFEEWKEDVKNRAGIFSVTERSQMIISHQALESLKITIKSIVSSIKYMLQSAGAPRVNARVLNQDPLEQYFGKMRRKQGDNKNPFLQGVLNTANTERSAAEASLPPRRGNTEVLLPNAGLEVDDSPLPKRTKKK
ncbi:Transposable element P transposase [Frankliniella fusca]|uniref:Transposable element P transposase n=1 Tax=Frankliniella fusca TaxID=407009 RepID=A0AAE1L5K1_9NEOP|nr:Transposable element P transposase [Frankliniella fusca]